MAMVVKKNGFIKAIESERTLEESAEGLLGHEDQQRRGRCLGDGDLGADARAGACARSGRCEHE